MRQILLLSVNGFTLQRFLLMTCLWVCFFATADETNPILTARSWLTLVDNAEYIKSWEQTDPLFKAKTPQTKWLKALDYARVPLGRVMSRTYFSTSEYSSLSGLPDGEYLVIKFKTEFINQDSAMETISLSKNNGQWQPLGYFIN